ncbi:hypothetical protein [Chryseobacterium sp. CFS15]|uniref:hypothetical protein n=1 Tax=Chryseobacterium sp. CFS15 TaxID=2986946 RepID=UPI0028094112|nr:hypothetical protein [Chryseobacterium sp. CFS15]MDQ8140440.1 hypothetical protein [Chryseobacterium sp. CFS15]
MKLNILTYLALEKSNHQLYEVLSLIAVMLILLAFVIYIFTKKYKKEEVRAPLEDDNTENSLDSK